MEIEAEDLAGLIASGKLTDRKASSFRELRLRHATDPDVAATIASSTTLARVVDRIILGDGEINDASVTILLLTPPCLAPSVVDMQGWQCVVALGDGVRQALMDRFGSGLLVTNQHWGR